MGESASAQPDRAALRRGRSRTLGSAVLTPPRGIPVLPDLRATAAERADLMRLLPPSASDLEAVVDPCVCGHGKAVHDHYRPGWDCGVCGAVLCTDYRAEGGGTLQRFLRRWGLSS